MEIDIHKWNLVPIPKSLKLLLNERNFYKVENDQLFYFTYSLLTNTEQDFVQYDLHLGESTADNTVEYDYFEARNLLEIIILLDKKRKEYPYFLTPKYTLELTLKSYGSIKQFNKIYRFPILKQLYFMWSDEYKQNGIAELKKKWIRMDEQNNQVFAKLELHDLERFEEVWKKSDLKNDFLCNININRI